MRKVFSLFFLIFALSAPGYYATTSTPSVLVPKTISGVVLGASAKLGITLSGSNVTGVNDLSGNGYTLTPTNSPTWSASSMNSIFPGITFNGSNQNLVRNASIGGARTEFSWWGIFKRTTQTNDHTLWYAPSSANWGSLTGDIYLSDNNSNSASLAYGVSNVGQRAVAAANAFPLGEVLELSGTYDGTTLKLNRNNQQVASSAVSSAQIGNKIEIGGLGDGQSGGFTGFNWNGVLGEIWFFDSALGSTTLDKLHRWGQYQWNDIWQFNQSSLYFPNTGVNGAYLDCGAGAFTFEYTQPHSWSVWTKLGNARADYVSFTGQERNTSDHKGFDFLMEAGSDIIGYYMAHDATNYVYSLSSTGIPSDGATWHNLIVTSDGSGNDSGNHFFADGKSIASQSPIKDTLPGGGRTIIDNSIHGFIGQAHGLSAFYGSMNNLALYYHALSSAEVTTIFNRGFPQPLDTNGISDLQNWWYMGNGTDTINTVYDRKGSLNCSATNGFGTIQPDVPLPFQH